MPRAQRTGLAKSRWRDADVGKAGGSDEAVACPADGAVAGAACTRLAIIALFPRFLENVLAAKETER